MITCSVLSIRKKVNSDKSWRSGHSQKKKKKLEKLSEKCHIHEMLDDSLEAEGNRIDWHAKNIH